MEGKTQLEKACYEIVGEKFGEYYALLSRLLILNPELIRNNDPRFSAQFTLILFDEEIMDKSHVVCELLDYMELNKIGKAYELSDAKELLTIDPVLNNTKSIINTLKNLPDPNYTQLMRKVPIKYQHQLYYNMIRYSKRRIKKNLI